MISKYRTAGIVRHARRSITRRSSGSGRCCARRNWSTRDTASDYPIVERQAVHALPCRPAATHNNQVDHRAAYSLAMAHPSISQRSVCALRHPDAARSGKRQDTRCSSGTSCGRVSRRCSSRRIRRRTCCAPHHLCRHSGRSNLSSCKGRKSRVLKLTVDLGEQPCRKSAERARELPSGLGLELDYEILKFVESRDGVLNILSVTRMAKQRWIEQGFGMDDDKVSLVDR